MVVVLSGTSPVRSISAATSVMAASVVSTGISEMAETAVVLPTPKPPAITIFTGIGVRRPLPVTRWPFRRPSIVSPASRGQYPTVILSSSIS